MTDISVHARPTPTPPVVPDFGWFYGITPTRSPALVYHLGNNYYPPGLTSLTSTTTFTPGGSTFTLNVNTTTTDVFATAGRITVQNPTTYAYAIVKFTGITTSGGLTTSFTGCSTLRTSTGSALTLSAGSSVYDPRFYFNQAPLSTILTFDTQDVHTLGLPTIYCPPGVTVRQYRWDFGNGETAFGTQASTTYNLSQPAPISVSLTVTDSLNREYGVAHPINLAPQSAILYATALRERG